MEGPAEGFPAPVMINGKGRAENRPPFAEA